MITALACSLVGQREEVRILPGTLAGRLYGAVDVAVEPFYCSFGLEPGYESLLEQHSMRVSGRDAEGHVRILELSDHPFFLATLFVPQARSRPGAPHPLVAGFVDAARTHVRRKAPPS